MLETGLGEDGSILCADKPFVSERADVLAHCVDAYPRRRTNRFVTGPALVGASVLTAEQIGVHRKLARR